MKNYFDVYEMTTNENISILFTPDNPLEYEIIIYKDNQEYKKELSSGNKNILLKDEGSYYIKVNFSDKSINSGNYIIDKKAPLIEFKQKVITIKQGIGFNPNDYIIVSDSSEYEIKTNYDLLDLNLIGAQTITYEVTDKSGNVSTKAIIVNVKKNNDNVLMIYHGIIGILIIILSLFMVWFQKKQKKYNRVVKYSVQGIKDNNKSLMDYLVNIFMNILLFVVRILNNSTFFKKQGEKYNKYIPLCSLKLKNGISLIALKIVLGFVFLILCAFSKVLLGDVISISECLFVYIIGYFLLDIKYIILYKKYHKQLEEDLLESVVIMNNAFKVGASLEQAIKIVGDEISGQLKKEYKQIYAEIKFGLSVNDAFIRFSDRLGLKEAEYIAASLDILNETGGNVVKIFDSIEKNLFNNRKIKNEYEALTGSPKLISNFLFVLPIIFILLILMINNEYFNPMFNSVVGIVLLIIAVIIYVLYIVIIRKILKIRM